MNPLDSTGALSSFPNVDAPGSSSPVRSRRDRYRTLALVAVGLVVGAAVGFGAGTRFAPPTAHAIAPVTAAISLAPRPGEFRLAPGNQQPVGVVVPGHREVDLDPRAGEFRLAPGNLPPAGVSRRAPATVDMGPRPGEFRLAPGNLQPAGIAIPAP
jgi:hypothetical protein